MKYVKGDATQPQASGSRIIAHICNTRGGWGRGFVLALSKRWKEPEQCYRDWYKQGFNLGDVQFVVVEEYHNGQIVVANMIAQEGISWRNGEPPIRYEALKKCLAKVAERAKEIDASIHMPRIGCGLAGGKWKRVEPIVAEVLAGISVTIYDL